MLIPPKKQPILICESDIAELNNQKEGTVSEADLLRVLSRYNLRDSLITIGRASNFISFKAPKEHKMGRIGYKDPNTGAMVTQFALAYLTNLFLISGANDHKSKSIGGQDNLLALCNLYSNVLVQPDLVLEWRAKNPVSVPGILIRMHTEQFENFQFLPELYVARTVAIFLNVIQRIAPQNGLPNLAKVFQEKTGLSLSEYLRLATTIWAQSAAAQAGPTFRLQNFTDARISALQDILGEEKVKSFINILRADYRLFREEDERVNKNVDPLFTKYRFNPLSVYPIIETARKDLGDPYIIPNNPLYLKKAFGGLYWWFHRFFEERGLQLKFRQYFGDVFQAYVGEVLKGIYGAANVHSEIEYDKNKFFLDWWVEKDGKIYFFEAKAYQFALGSKTGEHEKILKEVREKIVETVEQVYNRIADIPKFKSLSIFKGKKIIPVIVFFEMPFISTGLLKPLIEDALKEIEGKKKLLGLKDLEVHMLNIEELEQYDGCSPTIELEDVFAGYKDNPQEGFFSIAAKNGGGTNEYLHSVFANFGITMGVPSDSEITEA